MKNRKKILGQCELSLRLCCYLLCNELVQYNSEPMHFRCSFLAWMSWLGIPVEYVCDGKTSAESRISELLKLCKIETEFALLRSIFFNIGTVQNIMRNVLTKCDYISSARELKSSSQYLVLRSIMNAYNLDTLIPITS